MRPISRRILSIVLVAVLVPGLSAPLLLFGGGAASAAVPINRDRVKNVIFPTLGFPAIVKCGEQFTLEFDPRNQDWSKPLPQYVEFQVSGVTTNDRYPLTETFPVEHFTIGYSQTWPEYSQYREPRARIYLVTVTVPEDAPVHLYDITARARLSDGSWATDSQPHALQAVNDYKDDFNVAQLTDIHVWGPEAHYPGSTTHERNYRHSDYSETDGYGASYYHKTIGQVNREKPDFAVFTGDFDFSQKWLYQENYADFDAYKNSPWNGKYYEPWFEMDWFYEETLKMDVPVFMVLGNHDGYARYDLFNINLEEDYMASWRNLFGPQYYSFDYGSDYHFTAVNSMDWTSSQRNLHWVGGLPDVILMPGKWQGQVGSGGDAFQAGWSQAREDAINENAFTNQLLWLKDDLEAHPASKMRTVLMHCDPWRAGGQGRQFDDDVMFGLLPMGGKGAGRLSLVKLFRENRVALVLSGHEHSDGTGSISWEAGGGEVEFVNTTAVMFHDADTVFFPDFTRMWDFPGYRTVRIDDGDVVNYYYKVGNDSGGNPVEYSWPSYAGTNVGGETNYANLTAPAVESLWTPADPGDVENVSCQVTNHLCGREITPGGAWSGDIPSAFMEFPMPMLTGGYYYTVTNGMFGDIYENSDTAPDHRTYQVYSLVSHAPDESTPTVKTVSVDKSATPDVTAPTCTSFLIDGGAPSTDRVEVALTNNATDAESGMLDMMLSNDDPSFAGCEWQRWESSTSWELNGVGGLRTVYVKFRDRAMPANVSETYSATITLLGPPPVITSLDPASGHVGDSVEINGTDFGTESPSDKVRFNGLLADVSAWTDTKITCTVPEGAYTGVVTVTNDGGSVSDDFQVLPTIGWITPDHAYNDEPVHITNLEGNGFYSSGGYPHVKLVHGAEEITGTNVEFISPQSIACDFDTTGATVGMYSVVLENEDGGTDTLEGGFAVDWPPPVLIGITPSSGINDGPVDITDLSGDHFRAGMEVFLKSGETEIEATNVQVVSSTRATCTIDLTGAAAGAWDVYAVNDDGEGATLPGAFTVEYPAPAVAGVTPSQGFINGTVDVTDLAGAGFRAGAVVRLEKGGQQPIAATDVTVASANMITCAFDLRGAAAGLWDLVVQNDDGKTGRLAGGFLAGWSTTHVDSVTPATGIPGDVVTIQGSNFGSEQGAGTVRFGGVPAQEVVSWSGTQVRVRVPVGAAGNAPVVVTGGAGPSNDVAFQVFQPTWYLAEGSNAWGYDTIVSVENPQSDRTATIDVTYMTNAGPVAGGSFSLKPESQLTVNTAEVVPRTDFSTMVACREGFDIAVDRTMSWNSGIEGHSSIGLPGAAKKWYLAEGCSAFGFETWLLIGNPGGTPATCGITYMVEGEGPVAVTKTVPANSRASFNMADDIGAKNASIKVESDVPVIPERSMYRNNRTEGHCSIGTTTPSADFYLAEGSTAWGFTTWVLVQNPNPGPASVTLTYMTPAGPVAAEPVSLPPNTRLSINANAQVSNTDTSVHVHGDVPLVAERAMYWNNGTGEACHDSIGLAAPHNEFYLPDGQTSAGRKTWTLVQNPSDMDVTVEVRYLTDTAGGNLVFQDVVAANSRKTYAMSDLLASGRAAIQVTSKTPGGSIIVERSMYWNSQRAGTDTVGAYTD